MVYGAATLAACMFLGELAGNILGVIAGTNTDIGGVGFAMILLILVSNWDKNPLKKQKDFDKGIEFWKGMYIPVVIAMSACQNVKNALSGGVLALIAGLMAVIAAFLLLPLLNSMSSDKHNAKED